MLWICCGWDGVLFVLSPLAALESGRSRQSSKLSPGRNSEVTQGHCGSATQYEVLSHMFDVRSA